VFLSIKTDAFTQNLSKPFKTLISEQAYHCDYYEKNGTGEGSFSPFKEIKNANNTYRFEIYEKDILMKTKTSFTDFKIDSFVWKYSDAIWFYVHDQLGKKFIIQYLFYKSNGTEDNHIDIMEVDMINEFSRNTKYICRLVQ
jgi:hypothetical protein